MSKCLCGSFTLSHIVSCVRPPWLDFGPPLEPFLSLPFLLHSIFYSNLVLKYATNFLANVFVLPGMTISYFSCLNNLSLVSDPSATFSNKSLQTFLHPKIQFELATSRVHFAVYIFIIAINLLVLQLLVYLTRLKGRAMHYSSGH